RLSIPCASKLLGRPARVGPNQGVHGADGDRQERRQARRYIPDYSVWRSGFPLLVAEAKRPDEPIERALREAQLYANRINNRYPPNVNPIQFVLACNGERFALAPADSETDVLYAKAVDLSPGPGIVAAYKAILNEQEFEKRAQELNVKFQSRRFTRVPQLLTGTQVTEQLGINALGVVHRHEKAGHEQSNH